MRRMVAAGVAMIGIVLASAVGCGPPNAPVQCAGGDARNQIKCELPFSMDAFNVKGGLAFQQVGLNLETEKKALRQIDQGLQRYSLQAKNLCERYNACQITKEQYDHEISELNEILALKEKAEAAASAPPDSAERLAGISKAYRAFVPEAERVELTMGFSVVVARPLDPAKVPAQPCVKEAVGTYELGNPAAIVLGEAVPSGSRFHFAVRTSTRAYVYLFQRAKSGRVDVMFPQNGIGVTNPIAGGTEVVLPDGKKSYCSDEKDIGEEGVYVVASLEPITSLESTLAKIDGGDRAAFDSQFLGGSEPPASGTACKQRALPLVDDSPSTARAAPATGCLRPRGLPLTDDDPSPAARAMSADKGLKMRTEPGDKVIVGIFKFDHQTPADWARKSGR